MDCVLMMAFVFHYLRHTQLETCFVFSKRSWAMNTLPEAKPKTRISRHKKKTPMSLHMERKCFVFLLKTLLNKIYVGLYVKFVVKFSSTI